MVNYRLPTHVIPYLYEIEIKPYIGYEFNERSFTFDGKTNIHFNCVRPTDKVIFHINDLKIKNLALKNKNGGLQAQSIKFEKSKHFVIVEMKKNCTKINLIESVCVFVSESLCMCACTFVCECGV